MSSIALVEPGHNKLDHIKRQIIAGHERAIKGGSEWIEGSLILAAALREARFAHPADTSFRDWLKQNNLEFYSHHNRAALIGLAGDLELMRTILMKTDSRSYQRLWEQNKSRFTSASKPPGKTDKHGRYSKPRTYLKGRAMNHRRMKLGDEVVDMLKGTSLDSAIELDELVKLNRTGQANEVLRKIFIRQVSNIVPLYQLPPLLVAWEQADEDERRELWNYLQVEYGAGCIAPHYQMDEKDWLTWHHRYTAYKINEPAPTAAESPPADSMPVEKPQPPIEHPVAEVQDDDEPADWWFELQNRKPAHGEK